MYSLGIKENCICLYQFFLEDHGMIKHELNEIEEKLTFLFSDKLPPEDRLSPV